LLWEFVKWKKNLKQKDLEMKTRTVSVASKYDVEFKNLFGREEFEEKLARLQKYEEDLVSWKSEGSCDYELNRDLLRDLASSPVLPEELRDFSKQLLENSDQKLNYIRVEIWE